MAIVNCPECGEKVSTTVEQCVHCGCKFSVCPECGNVHNSKVSFCVKCGHAIAELSAEVKTYTITDNVAAPEEKPEDTRAPSAEYLVERWRNETPQLRYKVISALQTTLMILLFIPVILLLFLNIAMPSLLPGFAFLPLSGINILFLALAFMVFSTGILILNYMTTKSALSWGKKNNIDWHQSVERSLVAPDEKKSWVYALFWGFYSDTKTPTALYEIIWGIAGILGGTGFCCFSLFTLINFDAMLWDVKTFNDAINAARCEWLLILTVLLFFGSLIALIVIKVIKKRRIREWVKANCSERAYNKYVNDLQRFVK